VSRLLYNIRDKRADWAPSRDERKGQQNIQGDPPNYIGRRIIREGIENPLTFVSIYAIMQIQ